jgi:hypothetical protein
VSSNSYASYYSRCTFFPPPSPPSSLFYLLTPRIIPSRLDQPFRSRRLGLAPARRVLDRMDRIGPLTGWRDGFLSTNHGVCPLDPNAAPAAFGRTPGRAWSDICSRFPGLIARGRGRRLFCSWYASAAEIRPLIYVPFFLLSIWSMGHSKLSPMPLCGLLLCVLAFWPPSGVTKKQTTVMKELPRERRRSTSIILRESPMRCVTMFLGLVEQELIFV